MLRRAPSFLFRVAALFAVLVVARAAPPGHAAARILAEEDTVLTVSPATAALSPQVVVTRDGTVHVVWQDGDGASPVLRHRYRTPGGTWSAPTEVYWGGAQPALATDGSSVALAFVRVPFDRLDTSEILYDLWDPVARDWRDEPVAIQGDIGLAGTQPAVVFDRFSGYLWIVWTSARHVENRPYYARMRAADGEVESAGHIDAYEQGAQGPAIAVDDENNVHVAWSTNYANGDADISHWEWPEGGSTWRNRDSALYDRIRQARAPDIAAHAGVVCMAWHEGNLAQPNEILLSCDKSSGNVWFGNLSVSPASRSLAPALLYDDVLGALVAWRERPSGLTDQIVFTQGLPPPLPVPAQVTDGSAATVDAPSLAYHLGSVHAVWVAARASGGEDVHYARWRAVEPTPTSSPTRPPTVTPTPTRRATTVAPPPTATPTGTRGTPTASVTPSPTPTRHTPTSGATSTSTPTDTGTPLAPRDVIYLPELERRTDR